MSLLSKITGHDAKLRQRQLDEQKPGGNPAKMLQDATLEEGAGGGWQDAFKASAQSYLNQQLPQFRQNLQLTREDAIRRGVSTGDLGTSAEGDLTSAFQQNESNTLGGMAQSAYENSRNRYLDLLTGTIDRRDSNDNARKNRNASLWGAGIQTVGKVAAAAVGGGGG